jgi:hypothetical protein
MPKGTCIAEGKPIALPALSSFDMEANSVLLQQLSRQEHHINYFPQLHITEHS